MGRHAHANQRSSAGAEQHSRGLAQRDNFFALLIAKMYITIMKKIEFTQFAHNMTRYKDTMHESFGPQRAAARAREGVRAHALSGRVPARRGRPPHRPQRGEGAGLVPEQKVCVCTEQLINFSESLNNDLI